MAGPLIAVVGDVNPERTFVPPMRDPSAARTAGEELGTELAKRGARLLVYGGPFLEADVVRGFVLGKPGEDHSVQMWYSEDAKPPPFAEEATHRKLFTRRSEKGADWETAFYRSITRADGLIIIGGGNATNIVGQIAIGTRMPILALAPFGGAAKKVWDTLSAGEDLPNREEIDVMARPWGADSAAACVDALFAQHKRRRLSQTAPSPLFPIIAGVLFLAVLAIIPLVWGQNAFAVWMLFMAPSLAGGAGAAIRPMLDRLRGTQGVAPAVLTTVILGLVAGGIAGLLFVMAQLTADPQLIAGTNSVLDYAQRTILFAVGIGFIAGLTSDAVFAKLLGQDVIQESGLRAGLPKK
jgi:hypothetical protein